MNGTLEEEIAFILFDRDWYGTTLYEAYRSGEFDDDKGFDSPLDGLVDTVCEILERNPNDYSVLGFYSMEDENRWFRRVRRLVAAALRSGEFLEKRKG